MIVIFVDMLEDFLRFLEQRIMDEVFYEYKERTSSDLSINNKIEIVLHFLSKLENFLVLYETKLTLENFTPSDIDQQIIRKLKEVFKKHEIKLIKGKIREIFLSYS
ncbi:MAG: hypothetical protein ACTSU4_13675 [Promethearchaeota archaeon]